MLQMSTCLTDLKSQRKQTKLCTPKYFEIRLRNSLIFANAEPSFKLRIKWAYSNAKRPKTITDSIKINTRKFVRFVELMKKLFMVKLPQNENEIECLKLFFPFSVKKMVKKNGLFLIWKKALVFHLLFVN